MKRRLCCLELMRLGFVVSLTGAFMLPELPLNSMRACSICPLSPFANPTAVSARNSNPAHSSTSLNLLLDVPDGFFTITFPTLGILLSLSKNFARIRMEENAWEQRLAEARKERLRKDPTLTEIDLRRKEAAIEWSAYGKPRMEEEQLERDLKEIQRSRTRVMDRSEDEEDVVGTEREYCMTDEEIESFELEYGVEYDSYYDDPYSEEELPEGKFSLDRMYGDRVYDNGEIFYKDKESGLYYRQGAKPRNLSFWK
ncbi:predicted protein [Phaeodactylum tricornutum CCAP 1055/1]|uniref:Uncharacterized protein n=1 Tax=Phaeodactylum tricornutum (strain CCAP 1055/1) TaxID=556484 RepID=B7FTY1_PHATC|nr:predicted protein [Phaeodactylum tricornutum CCAP 1055/1]EEC50168.1 predicted protein [Phaeodactylum tricornutum CCAP 1055/1]|eukprot:XP_002178503.1 predicted protein [Phaeodactylum tricornutum CCAP 1055/1]